MGLPDIATYYRAMALVRIMNWCHDSVSKLWVHLEKTLAGRNMVGAPWILASYRGLSEWISTLTKTTLSIWDRLNNTGKFALSISSMTPLEGFPWFPLGEEKGTLDQCGMDGKGNCAGVAPQPLFNLLVEQKNCPI